LEFGVSAAGGSWDFPTKKRMQAIDLVIDPELRQGSAASKVRFFVGSLSSIG
jgi:hypothetical protein